MRALGKVAQQHRLIESEVRLTPTYRAAHDATSQSPEINDRAFANSGCAQSALAAYQNRRPLGVDVSRHSGIIGSVVPNATSTPTIPKHQIKDHEAQKAIRAPRQWPFTYVEYAFQSCLRKRRTGRRSMPRTSAARDKRLEPPRIVSTGISERLFATRKRSLALAAPLTPEDMVVQAMEDASPTK